MAKQETHQDTSRIFLVSACKVLFPSDIELTPFVLGTYDLLLTKNKCDDHWSQQEITAWCILAQRLITSHHIVEAKLQQFCAQTGHDASTSKRMLLKELFVFTKKFITDEAYWNKDFAKQLDMSCADMMRLECLIIESIKLQVDQEEYETAMEYFGSHQHRMCQMCNNAMAYAMYDYCGECFAVHKASLKLMCKKCTLRQAVKGYRMCSECFETLKEHQTML